MVSKAYEKVLEEHDTRLTVNINDQVVHLFHQLREHMDTALIIKKRVKVGVGKNVPTRTST